MTKAEYSYAPAKSQAGCLGAHMSVAGGLHNAFDAGEAAGCDCLQIFVKNQRQWAGTPLTRETVAAFAEARARTGLSPVIAHATYLINLASPDRENRNRSIGALVDEVRRCAALGVEGLVLHPGAHMGQGLTGGIGRIIRCLDQVRRRVSPAGTRLLLETTAGQGTSIGHEIAHLGRVIGGVRDSDWLGVCLDTCHVFAAGYDIRTSEGFGRMIDEIDDLLGMSRVRCIHVNDSKRECGSRVDRHEHITKGEIGKEGFRRLVNDPRLGRLPLILETPKGVDGRGTDLDRVNLKRLRRLVDPN